MSNWIQDLASLSKQLPTGLYDPNALEKMHAELDELQQAQDQGDDWVTQILEACDVLYYAAKSVLNDLLPIDNAKNIANTLALTTGLSIPTLVECAKLKYSLRAAPGNPKRPLVERAAVHTLLEMEQWQ